MGRRRNRPAAILSPIQHHPECCCDRCIDEDAAKLEKRLDHQRAKYEASQAIDRARHSSLHVTNRQSPVIGPFEGNDESKAVYLNVPVAICTTIIPKGKRRK